MCLCVESLPTPPNVVPRLLSSLVRAGGRRTATDDVYTLGLQWQQEPGDHCSIPCPASPGPDSRTEAGPQQSSRTHPHW